MIPGPRPTIGYGFCLPPQEILKHPRHKDQIHIELAVAATALTLAQEARQIWPNTIYKALTRTQAGAASGGAGYLLCTNSTSDTMKKPPPEVVERLKECLNLDKDLQPRFFKL